MSALLETQNVPYVGWREFRAYLNRIWEQGQHGFIIGTTGRGKSTLGRELIKLPRRKAIVILDAKGGSPSLSLPGFTRIKSWPPDVHHGQRIRLAPPMNHPDDIPEMREQFLKCLNDIMGVGLWTVYIDELRPVVEPAELNLKAPVERALILGRERKATMITGTQAPRWVPRASYDQSTHIFMFKILDKASQQRLSEIGGDTETIKRIVPKLGAHEFLYVNAVTGEMVICQVGRG